MALQDITRRFTDAIAWRLRTLEAKMRKGSIGTDQTAWVRIRMNEATESFVRGLSLSKLDALEIGGMNWQAQGFRGYQSIDYPEYDVCAGPYREEAYDLIFLEQVLEHVLWPFRAVRNIHAMLRPGGYAIITTPFLVKIHAYPIDCSRWTELGLKHLLAEGGFDLSHITTGSWGNRQAVKAGFHKVPRYRPWLHSLENESTFPVMIWAFARKAAPLQ